MWQTRVNYMRSNMLLKCFHTRDHDLQMRLFNAFIRTILEYNSPVRSSHLTKDINVIEQAQTFFTKNLCGLKKLLYSRRLKQPTLQSRRTRTDLFICLKY